MMCVHDARGATRQELTRAVLEVVSRVAGELASGVDLPAPRVEQPRAQPKSEGPSSVQELENEIDGLRTAMLNRAVIEQAKGMIMLRHGCDEDAAFSVLIRASQQVQLKLRDVATHIVEWGSTRSMC
jgi:hypothetical protein